MQNRFGSVEGARATPAAGTAASAALFAVTGGRDQTAGVTPVPVSDTGARELRWSGFRSLPFLVLIGLVLLWMTAPALVQPFFNLYFARVHDLSVDRIGWVFGLSHAVTAVLIFGSGELAARFGLYRILSFWTLVFGPSLWALTFVVGVPGAVASEERGGRGIGGELLPLDPIAQQRSGRRRECGDPDCFWVDVAIPP